MKLFINGGRNAEDPARRGLAYMTARLCVELPSSGDVKKMMDLGSSFDVAVEGDFSVITLECLSKNFGETAALLGDILEEPLFSSLRIEHVKKTMLGRQKSGDDNLEGVALRESLDIIFGGCGYGGSGMGDEKSLAAIESKDIWGFYRRFFNLANMTAVVATDLDSGAVEAVLAKNFSSLPAGNGREAVPAPMAVRGDGARRRFVKKETLQQMIAWVYPLPALTAEHYACGYILRVLLGDGIGSRLWPIRMKGGLAYDVDSALLAMKHAGLLAVYVKTGASGLEQAELMLTGIMRDIYENGVPPAEFEAARIRAAAHFWRKNETKEKQAFQQGFFEYSGLEHSFAGVFPAFLEKMDAEVFARYIRSVLKPEQGCRILVGPKDSR